MLRVFSAAVVLLTGLAMSVPTAAQDINNRYVAARMLNALGMEREWETHAQVDPTYGKIDDGLLHVDSQKSHTQYVLTYGKNREVIQETDIGPTGEPYGVLGAQDAANLRVEILSAEGIDAEVTEEVLPVVTLYLLTDQFVVQAIDAETGATKWATQVGRRGWPTSKLGVSDDFVCLTNGMTLYCLDAHTGKPLWNKLMERASGGGPLITENFVYVPKINGEIEVFNVNDPKEPSDRILGFGRAMNSPKLTPLGNAVWVSDRNTLFVAPTGETVSPFSYRIGFNRPISGNVALGAGDTLVVGTDDGAIHCLSEPKGALLWKQFIENPLREDPLVVGDDVFLVALGQSLTVLSLETGQEKWFSDGINQVLSVTNERVYTKDRVGRVIIFDRATGRRISVVNSFGLSFAVTNPVTDRLYVGTRSGLIQCVRQIDKPRAELNIAMDLTPNIPVLEPADVGAKPGLKPVTPKPTEPAVDDSDPFGVKKDDDPFGVGR